MTTWTFVGWSAYNSAGMPVAACWKDQDGKHTIVRVQPGGGRVMAMPPDGNLGEPA